MERPPQHFHNPDTLNRARELRRRATDAEQVLWRALRGRQLGDAKFRRQVVVGPYFLDFYCLEKKLALEIDGLQHIEPDTQEYDTLRTAYLEATGITVLRFTNDSVLNHPELTLRSIKAALNEPSASNSNPP